jgi:hypothetical protein
LFINDLILFISEVHGICVVSKYSRSKTFDSNPKVMRALKEQHGFVADEQSPTSRQPCCTYCVSHNARADPTDPSSPLTVRPVRAALKHGGGHARQASSLASPLPAADSGKTMKGVDKVSNRHPLNA